MSRLSFCAFSEMMFVFTSGQWTEKMTESTESESPLGLTSAGSHETAYIPVRILGRGAFGEAVLYRRLEDNSLVVWKEVRTVHILMSWFTERKQGEAWKSTFSPPHADWSHEIGGQGKTRRSKWNRYFVHFQQLKHCLVLQSLFGRTNSPNWNGVRRWWVFWDLHELCFGSVWFSKLQDCRPRFASSPLVRVCCSQESLSLSFAGGNLYEKVMRQKELFHEETVIWYCFQLASAVDHIHDFGILHRWAALAANIKRYKADFSTLENGKCKMQYSLFLSIELWQKTTIFQRHKDFERLSDEIRCSQTWRLWHFKGKKMLTEWKFDTVTLSQCALWDLLSVSNYAGYEDKKWNGPFLRWHPVLHVSRVDQRLVCCQFVLLSKRQVPQLACLTPLSVSYSLDPFWPEEMSCFFFCVPFKNRSSKVGIGRPGGLQIPRDQVLFSSRMYTGTYFLSSGEQYNQKSDIWAMGCVLYELLTLTKVFDATNPLKLAQDIVCSEFGEIDPR